MKILYVTTVGQTMGFFTSFIKELVEAGHAVDIVCNEKEGDPVPPIYSKLGCRFYHIDCSRNPISPGNLRAIRQLRRLGEENAYDIVHCHTPVAGVCARVAFKNLRGKELIGTDGAKHKVRVFYTAHGFHFYKGAPKKNWIVFYPIEKYYAKFTDVLITINKEDYALARKKFSNGGKCRIEYIPGVGIDIERFENVPGIEGGTGKLNPTGDWTRGGRDRQAKRKELGVPEDAFLLISAGELNANKNHQIVINAISEIKDENIYYIIAGDGRLKPSLQQLIDDRKLTNRVFLIGQRNDLPELYKASDVCVFPSIREGLGLVALEAMASGLPLICSDNRGTRDYAMNNVNAVVCADQSVSAYSKAIEEVYADKQKSLHLGINGARKAENFSLEKSLSVQRRIYELKPYM